jgi:hypothetical protein
VNPGSALRWVAAVVLTAASLPVPFHEPWSSANKEASLIAFAHASDIDQSVTDLRSQSVELTRGGHARAASTASALCAGCTGKARTVQVVYASSEGGVAADNVAVAWSSCDACGSSALAVQVVAMRHSGDVVATNRALAVNIACTGCQTESLAIQFVLVGGNGRNLSTRVEDLLDALGAQLGEDLGIPDSHGQLDPHFRAGHPATSGATDQEKAVGDALKEDLGASSVEIRVDARHGAPTTIGSPSP